MKIFPFLLILILIFQIQSQQQQTQNTNVQQNPQQETPNSNAQQNPQQQQIQNNNAQQNPQQQKNETQNNVQKQPNPINETKSNDPKSDTSQQKNETQNNSQQLTNANNDNKSNPQQNTSTNNQQNNNNDLNQNTTHQKELSEEKKKAQEKLKQIINNLNISTNADIKNKTKEKPFNLTESLIDFFIETFGNKTNRNNTEKKDKNDTKANVNEEIENRRKEYEMQQKLLQERDRKRREEFEARKQAEMIRLENKKKEEMKKREQQERRNFENKISNTTFDEIIQISLERGETETLYLDLNAFQRIKMAVILTDEEEKCTFVFSGPNSRGRTSPMYKVNNKNYLFYEYETVRKGEYIIEITNKGSKENEIVFLLQENKEKKKDNINTEKIDKISLLLDNIDNNVNQLRIKKRIEIKQINSHNNKVNKYNTSMVTYSIIEIFTMIGVFIAQSYYISSMVKKI